jgi:hypothetical protein
VEIEKSRSMGFGREIRQVMTGTPEGFDKLAMGMLKPKSLILKFS